MSYTDSERTSLWLETLFVTDPNMPGAKIARRDNLVVGQGVVITEEDAEERIKVYNFDAIQNAYKMLHLCSNTDSPSKSESLVHAHAETFLKRAYAAWNLSGQTRKDYEESLKVYVNASLSDLFSLHAPICNPNTNEILALQDIYEELETLRHRVDLLNVEILKRDELIEELRETLENSKERERYYDLNMQDAIKGATLQLQEKYDYLVVHSDLVVAAAVKECENNLRLSENFSRESQASLKAQKEKTLEQEALAQERLVLLKEAELEINRIVNGPQERPRQSRCSIM
jgi:hypothetical protein